MEQDSTRTATDGMEPFSGEAWFDPIETGVRERVRRFIEELLQQELTQALGRARHERTSAEPKGYRNGTRERTAERLPYGLQCIPQLRSVARADCDVAEYWSSVQAAL